MDQDGERVVEDKGVKIELKHGRGTLKIHNVEIEKGVKTEFQSKKRLREII